MALADKFDGLELPASADLYVLITCFTHSLFILLTWESFSHVHLRDGAMMEAVVPTIREELQYRNNLAHD